MQIWFLEQFRRFLVGRFSDKLPDCAVSVYGDISCSPIFFRNARQFTVMHETIFPSAE